ncbi:MAG: NAD(P)/FAD-dependent oxidoreductase [Saprospiraceae bacterium]|nr:NAD(P)/FAD-dependent oxidoreductase [Saprospiraceae bacterium]
MKTAIIGGGAAGFFAAITCAEASPGNEVHIFERGKTVLEKVRISGGGRCNVTHHCFDTRELVKNYPRGSRELIGPFSRFGPEDTVQWFSSRGVLLKTESDGRMFPVTDSSQTIIDCLSRAAHNAGVKVHTSSRIEKIRPQDGRWQLDNQIFDQVMIAAGSSTFMWEVLAGLGHTIIPPVPSLFTFNTKDTRLRDLSGVSVQRARLSVPGTRLTSEGPLLITHWGLSGPAVLRLSAWGAREFREMDYKFQLEIQFSADAESFDAWFGYHRQHSGKKTIASHAQEGMPARLWQRLTEAGGIDMQKRWADLDKISGQQLYEQLTEARFQITGKSTNKDEFVTAGGVSLKEINFNTFESRVCPGLFLAGEILDIDAITGGFNFQAAWTGGYLAGKAIHK